VHHAAHALWCLVCSAMQGVCMATSCWRSRMSPPHLPPPLAHRSFTQLVMVWPFKSVRSFSLFLKPVGTTRLPCSMWYRATSFAAAGLRDAALTPALLNAESTGAKIVTSLLRASSTAESPGADCASVTSFLKLERSGNCLSAAAADVKYPSVCVRTTRGAGGAQRSDWLKDRHEFALAAAVYAHA